MAGRTTARGYGWEHQRLRAQWAPLVATGQVRCVRCGLVIGARAKWDLGHHDTDRSRYTGPEHMRCNRQAAARMKNAGRRVRQAVAKVTAIRW
jgi:hypothetical protein